jgi:hypothetical protein
VLARHLLDQFAYRAYAGLSIQATSPDSVRCMNPVLHTQVLCRNRCVPPVFLLSFVALAEFMRLSFVKAAHAVVSSVTYRKSGFHDRPWAFFLNN